MSTDDNQEMIDAVGRQSRIIVGTLVAGVSTFLVIATVLDPGLNARGGTLEIGRLLTWIAVGVAAVVLPLSFIVPGAIANQGRRALAAGKWAGATNPGGSAVASDADAARLASLFMNRLIVGAALDEGAAFFAGIAYLLGKDPIALGVAVVMLAAILVRFPTTPRITQWIDHQQEMLLLERQSPS